MQQQTMVQQHHGDVPIKCIFFFHGVKLMKSTRVLIINKSIYCGSAFLHKMIRVVRE